MNDCGNKLQGIIIVNLYTVAVDCPCVPFNLLDKTSLFTLNKETGNSQTYNYTHVLHVKVNDLQIAVTLIDFRPEPGIRDEYNFPGTFGKAKVYRKVFLNC